MEYVVAAVILLVVLVVGAVGLVVPKMRRRDLPPPPTAGSTTTLERPPSTPSVPPAEQELPPLIERPPPVGTEEPPASVVVEEPPAPVAEEPVLDRPEPSAGNAACAVRIAAARSVDVERTRDDISARRSPGVSARSRMASPPKTTTPARSPGRIVVDHWLMVASAADCARGGMLSDRSSA